MITADLSGIGAFIGGVQGTLRAVETPGTKKYFIGSLTNTIKNAFMADVIAAKESGYKQLNHMFEWGNLEGETSNVPLFKVTRSKAGPTAVNVGFVFLPSTKFVPLPNPAKYGFSPYKLRFLKRHVFYMKALVMETQSSVTISPSGDKGLFIPAANRRGGYLMTHRSVTINPGGESSTGGFTTFWTNWFESRGNQITAQFAQKVEEDLGLTGRKAVRYAAGTVVNGKKVGGQFASGRGVSINYVNAKASASQQYAERLIRTKYADGGDLGD